MMEINHETKIILILKTNRSEIINSTLASRGRSVGKAAVVLLSVPSSQI